MTRIFVAILSMNLMLSACATYTITASETAQEMDTTSETAQKKETTAPTGRSCGRVTGSRLGRCF